MAIAAVHKCIGTNAFTLSVPQLAGDRKEVRKFVLNIQSTMTVISGDTVPNTKMKVVVSYSWDGDLTHTPSTLLLNKQTKNKTNKKANNNNNNNNKKTPEKQPSNKQQEQHILNRRNRGGEWGYCKD